MYFSLWLQGRVLDRARLQLADGPMRVHARRGGGKVRPMSASMGFCARLWVPSVRRMPSRPFGWYRRIGRPYWPNYHRIWCKFCGFLRLLIFINKNFQTALGSQLQQFKKNVYPLFQSTQSGYFTRRKLDSMREHLDRLKPKFDEVDPRQVNLTGLIQE